LILHNIEFVLTFIANALLDGALNILLKPKGTCSGGFCY